MNIVIVGAGAQILGGIEIGDAAMIGAGSLVTFDVPARGRVRAAKAELQADTRDGLPEDSQPEDVST